MKMCFTTVRILFAALSVVLLAAACTTSSGPAPSSVERSSDGSFEVVQDVRVGVTVRADFDAALRLLEGGEYEAGIARLSDVLDAAPQLVSAHINLAIAHRHLEQWEQAQASAERAVELSPKHPVAHNELGMIQRRQGKFEEARASYGRALKQADEFHFARRNLAILCDLFLHDVSCALEHYELYAQAVPEDEAVGMWIADLRNRVGTTPAGARE